MPAVRPCDVPPQSLLHAYQVGPGFADCYVVDVPGYVSPSAFIEAFYTSPLFRIERALLGLLAGRPASDEDARQLAAGRTERFSAWRVEGHAPTQILLADMTGRTRSWLQALAVDRADGTAGTRLYFGSAVVPRTTGDTGKADMGWLFHALLGFHRLYSRLLLQSACGRVHNR